jgi:maltooligosyltrehalose trehalohydrolase
MTNGIDEVKAEIDKVTAGKSGRKYSIGAECVSNGVSFRVWAPDSASVSVIYEKGHGADGSTCLPLIKEDNGFFSLHVENISEGIRYWFRLDDDAKLYPDPGSRSQPDGPHGSSQVVNPSTYEWDDEDWSGIKLPGQVFYELHVGTFTPEGTFAAAQRELAELKKIGITTIELMPVADFAGTFGWGYDGVNLFAPSRLYGCPDDLRAFINEAHKLGLGVILDVVYNHFGADGNYAPRFSKYYFSESYECEWGDAINFDGPHSQPVRDFFLSNAAYWIDEYHFDGLRLDATQQIYDTSEVHILREICDSVRNAAGKKHTIIVGENELQDTKLLKPAELGGYTLDCLWNDDFHHASKVAMTGKNEAYFADYLGTPQELISAIKHGYLYQGQFSKWKNKGRGTPSLKIPPAKFVNFIQNHDQIANSGRGWRADRLTSSGRYKAMMTLLLLTPGSPMLFQGQEFASSAPFTYFADHEPELAKLVDAGRKKSLSIFRSMNNETMLCETPVPHERGNFEACKLDFAEREKHREMYTLTKELLALRKNDVTFSRQEKDTVDGAVLSDEAFVIRFFGNNSEDDRLVLVNLGRDLDLMPIPEPLLAPPEGYLWSTTLSTEEPRFGGSGAADATADTHFYLTAHSAIVLSPRAA